MSKHIPLSVPNLKGNELQYVTQAIDQEWVSTGGAFITRFEKEFAIYAKTDRAIALQSGTAALHLALLEAGVGNDDLVVAPTLTFIAAINPIHYVGADPVFMDCNDNLCMDVDKLADYLLRECERRSNKLYDKQQNRPVAAILVVHIFGNAADMDYLMDLAEQYDLPIIEDATEAVGTFYTTGRYAGRMCGAIGNFGAYSFNGNKIITTGGGGMLVGRDSKQVEHIKYLSTQAKDDELYYVHEEVGYNYRMTNLQAALGVAQLEQLEHFIEIKKALYAVYMENGVQLLPFSEATRPNYWFFSHLSNDRDGLIQYLQSKSIQTRPIWNLNHLQKPYLHCRTFAIETALRYYEAIVNLPCSSNLPLKGAAAVATKVMQFELQE